MSAERPIADDDLDQLFAGLGSYRLLLIAVSGGADSSALMHLVARWLKRQSPDARPMAHIATVDHDLRPGSRQEADVVAVAANLLDLPHHCLTWHGTKPETGLQDAARAARYGLMTQLLRDLGEPNAALVTAHTADDQAETVLMRLARGSGVDGLSAMAAKRRLLTGAPYDLLRPLLGVRKSRLIATLQADGITWSEDPSNARLEFERVRLRAAAETLSGLGLTPEKLAASARRLRRVRTAIEAVSLTFEHQVLNLNQGAFASIDRAAFAHAPAELRLRLLTRVLSRFGGSSPPARLSQIESLLDRLEQSTPLTLTLGGCIVTAASSGLRVFREPGRKALPEYDLRDENPVIWDSRFAVSVVGLSIGSSAAITVKALGAAGYATLEHLSAAKVPRQAATTLPSFWSGNTLLAVPALPPSSGLPPGPALKTPPFTFRTDFLGLPDDPRISD